jgi:hypothetical protein
MSQVLFTAAFYSLRRRGDAEDGAGNIGLLLVHFPIRIFSALSPCLCGSAVKH